MLKAALRRKELVLGSWLQFGYPLITEMFARKGFDFLAIDMEHGPISLQTMAEQIQLISLAGCAPMVRVGANDPLLIKRAMDAGAAGVIVPMIESAEQAKRAVEAAYYPPKGTRGVGLARAQGFGLDFDSYREKMADETVVIVQIEHKNAVGALESILAVDGVDGFMVGPYDMSASFGKPGDFDNPDFLAAMDRVASFVATHDKPGGLHVVHPGADNLIAKVREGYRFIAYGTDMLFLAHMLDRETPGISGAREAAR
jgi:2-dehydro-3-deoxyglucarate aldolase